MFPTQEVHVRGKPERLYSFLAAPGAERRWQSFSYWQLFDQTSSAPQSHRSCRSDLNSPSDSKETPRLQCTPGSFHKHSWITPLSTCYFASCFQKVEILTNCTCGKKKMLLASRFTVSLQCLPAEAWNYTVRALDGGDRLRLIGFSVHCGDTIGNQRAARSKNPPQTPDSERRCILHSSVVCLSWLWEP